MNTENDIVELGFKYQYDVNWRCGIDDLGVSGHKRDCECHGNVYYGP